jgi:hypothetical protein
MYNKLYEFQDFKRRRDEMDEKVRWEHEYRTQTKEMLLNMLIEQQEKKFPLKNGDRSDKRKFSALVTVLLEKTQSNWLKSILSALKN